MTTFEKPLNFIWSKSSIGGHKFGATRPLKFWCATLATQFWCTSMDEENREARPQLVDGGDIGPEFLCTTCGLSCDPNYRCFICEQYVHTFVPEVEVGYGCSTVFGPYNAGGPNRRLSNACCLTREADQARRRNLRSRRQLEEKSADVQRLMRLKS